MPRPPPPAMVPAPPKPVRENELLQTRNLMKYNINFSGASALWVTPTPNASRVKPSSAPTFLECPLLSPQQFFAIFSGKQNFSKANIGSRKSWSLKIEATSLEIVTQQVQN